MTDAADAAATAAADVSGTAAVESDASECGSGEGAEQMRLVVPGVGLFVGGETLYCVYCPTRIMSNNVM